MSGTHAVCPGSFDPPTNGHLDVIVRTSRLFDRVTVAVLVNPDKSGMFAVPDRLALLQEITRELPNVEVDSFTGLLVEFCRARGIHTIVKGLRAVSDFDYELQMAQMNLDLTAPDSVDTLFLPARPAYSFLSSSLIKQVASLGGDVSELLPPTVAAALADKLAVRAR